MITNPNAIISYIANNTYKFHPLWVNILQQDLNLTASKHQSRRRAHVYPRSHAPGDLAITGTCQSQEDYQKLSLFIRQHQEALIDTPYLEKFTRVTKDSPGFKRLLRFSVPTEGIIYYGWINAFTLQKRGVFEPAPEFQFNFFIVYDLLSEDILISHKIKRQYESDADVYASKKGVITDEDITPELPGRGLPRRN